MSAFFPKWSNRLPLIVLAGGVLFGGAAVAGLSYYFTPKYTRVGYQPIQPISFSHSVHAGQLGMDCRYCHNGVEKSWYSNVPAASTCMNCHSEVLKDDPRLELVRQSFTNNTPVPWVQIHKTPDYVYFNHAVHVNRGVSCVHCHGPVNKMDEVSHTKSLSMTFCLECHRDPAAKIRPVSEVFNLDWQAPPGFADRDGQKYVHDWRVRASENCSACHR